MIFKVISVKYISTTATITDSGIDAAITSVGFITFKNKSNTKMASIGEMIGLRVAQNDGVEFVKMRGLNGGEENMCAL